MAARKKARAKAKSKRKVGTARKPAPRKTSVQMKKKPVARKTSAGRAAAKKRSATGGAAPKKTAARRVAPVKRPASRTGPMKQTRAATPAAKAKSVPRTAPPEPRTAAPASAPAAAPAAASASPQPPANEERIGTVTHYYSHLSVAVVKLDAGSLRLGDTVHITGHTSDFRQPVESLEIDHQAVTEVTAGQEFGMKVVDHAREHDAVYRVKAT